MKVNTSVVNQETISLGEHLNYISSLSMKKDRYYFLVKYKDEHIGVIDFTNIDYKNKITKFGLYVKPETKGFGSLLMILIINYSFFSLKIDRLNAEVFSENIQAFKLYKKFNFKEVGSKLINNKKVIFMELLYENS